MSNGDQTVSATFKRCRSAIDLTDPVLIRIAREIRTAETLLVQYLEDVAKGERGNNAKPSKGAGISSATDATRKNALDHLSQLVVRELQYLRKVKASKIVDVSGAFVTFRSDDGDILVTLVPEEELRRTCQPLFSFSNVRPRFTKPVEKEATPSQSDESVYYDARCDPDEIPVELPEDASTIKRSIYGLLKYIFDSTIGKLESKNT